MTLTNEKTRQFTCEKFHPPFSNGANIHWNYRDNKGKSYSGTSFSVDDARAEAKKQSGEEIIGTPNGSVSETKGGVV